MSPLKLSLLLRAYSMPRPNQDLPAEQAYAPAMVEAANSLVACGLLRPITSVSTLRIGYALSGGRSAMLITGKGEALVKRITDAAADFYREATE